MNQNLRAIEIVKGYFEDLQEYFPTIDEKEENIDMSDVIEFYEDVLDNPASYRRLRLDYREVREAVKKLMSLYYMPLRNLVLQMLYRYSSLPTSHFVDTIGINRTTILYHLELLVENELLMKEYKFEEVENNFGMTMVRVSWYRLNPRIRKLLIKYRLNKELHDTFTSAYILLNFYEIKFPEVVHTSNPDLRWWEKEKTISHYIEEYHKLLRRLRKIESILKEAGVEINES